MKKVPRMYYMFSKNGDAYDIYLYDDITDNKRFNWETYRMEDAGTSAAGFKKEMDALPENAEIHLYLNSNGGSVKEGTAIYNMLRRHKGHKVGYVDGAAHSIAFTIFQACDHRVMGEGTSCLIHFPWVCTAGNADELRAEAQQLDALSDASVSLLMSRAKGISENELREMMKKETILTPDMALKYGFCDEIADREADIEPVQAAGEIKEIKSALQNSNFPDTLKEFVTLTKKKETEPKNEVSEMDAFFNAFL